MTKTDDLHDANGAIIGARFTRSNGDDVIVQVSHGFVIGHILHPTRPEMIHAGRSLPLTADFKSAAIALFPA